jgi:hypothetical protein
MLTRTQALEGGANVTCISKVRFTYRSFIRLTILATMLQSSLKDVAEIFVLFLHGVQLVPSFSVHTIFDLNDANSLC